jgi:hypothetical protein
MQTEREIHKRINEILTDERLSYKTADIFTNAPLALIQLEMETELHILENVLELPLTNIKKLRKEYIKP